MKRSSGRFFFLFSSLKKAKATEDLPLLYFLSLFKERDYRRDFYVSLNTPIRYRFLIDKLCL